MPELVSVRPSVPCGTVAKSRSCKVVLAAQRLNFCHFVSVTDYYKLFLLYATGDIVNLYRSPKCPGSAVGPMCVCPCVRTINLKRLARWQHWCGKHVPDQVHAGGMTTLLLSLWCCLCFYRSNNTDQTRSCLLKRNITGIAGFSDGKVARVLSNVECS